MQTSEKWSIFREKEWIFSSKRWCLSRSWGSKKIKGNGGTFALVGRSLVFRPPLARLRVRAPQRFSIFAFTPSPYPFKPLINNKIKVNIAHRKAFTCLFTAGWPPFSTTFGHYPPILLKQRTLCFRRTLQNVNNRSYLIESQAVASKAFTTFTLPSPFFRP